MASPACCRPSRCRWPWTLLLYRPGVCFINAFHPHTFQATSTTLESPKNLSSLLSLHYLHHHYPSWCHPHAHLKTRNARCWRFASLQSTQCPVTTQCPSHATMPKSPENTPSLLSLHYLHQHWPSWCHPHANPNPNHATMPKSPKSRHNAQVAQVAQVTQITPQCPNHPKTLIIKKRMPTKHSTHNNLPFFGHLPQIPNFVRTWDARRKCENEVPCTGGQIPCYLCMVSRN